MPTQRMYKTLEIQDVYVTKISPAVYILARRGEREEDIMLFVSPAMRTIREVRDYADTHFDQVLHNMWPESFPAPLTLQERTGQ